MRSWYKTQWDRMLSRDSGLTVVYSKRKSGENCFVLVAWTWTKFYSPLRETSLCTFLMNGTDFLKVVFLRSISLKSENIHIYFPKKHWKLQSCDLSFCLHFRFNFPVPPCWAMRYIQCFSFNLCFEDHNFKWNHCNFNLAPRTPAKS